MQNYDIFEQWIELCLPHLYLLVCYLEKIDFFKMGGGVHKYCRYLSGGEIKLIDFFMNLHKKEEKDWSQLKIK